MKFWPFDREAIPLDGPEGSVYAFRTLRGWTRQKHDPPKPAARVVRFPVRLLQQAIDTHDDRAALRRVK